MIKRTIGPSELIINPDGSIYHLNLKPNEIADTVIFVGDQDRVPVVARHFDTINFEKQKREFRTITGVKNGKPISVISTGIGPDNIDIVINELDALVNIDFNTRQVKDELTSLNIVRIGTSGSLHDDIPVDSFVLGTHGIGFDGVLHSYQTHGIIDSGFVEAFIAHTRWNSNLPRPYVVKNSKELQRKLEGSEVFKGITATADGFYGPQGRVLRLPVMDNDLNQKIKSFSYKGLRITNLEMETSAIYGLSKLLGHEACSMNAIIANRSNITFTKNPYKVIEKLVAYTLEKLTL
jgi:uridine phosphorylase